MFSNQKNILNRNFFFKIIVKEFVKSNLTISNLNKIIGSTNNFTNPIVVYKSKNHCQIQKNIANCKKNVTWCWHQQSTSVGGFLTLPPFAVYFFSFWISKRFFGIVPHQLPYVLLDDSFLSLCCLLM